MDLYQVNNNTLYLVKYLEIHTMDTGIIHSSLPYFWVYFLTGCNMSKTFPISPFFASRRLVSQPPSLENPMFIIAWRATCILGSGCSAVTAGAVGVVVGAVEGVEAAASPWLVSVKLGYKV